MRRGGMARPSGWVSNSSEASTPSVFSSGSPIPMKTTLRRPPPAPRARAAASASITWPAISPAVRLRAKGTVPERQKVQASGQPTWVETQTVRSVGVPPAPFAPERTAGDSPEIRRGAKARPARPPLSPRRFRMATASTS